MSGSSRYRKGVKWCEGLIEWGTISLLIFSPLAFGAVETWACSVLVGGCLLIGGADRLRRRLEKSPPDPPVSFLPPRSRPAGLHIFFVFGLIFLLAALVQVIPLPLSLIGTFSPGSAKYWLLSGRAGVHSWATFSLYPWLSVGELIKLAAYLLFFFVLKNYHPRGGSRNQFVSRVVATTVATGFAVSVIGILQKYSWGGRIYGLRPIRFGNPFGPFVNRNHFAGYIIMVIPLALGMLLPRPGRRTPAVGNDLRNRLVQADPRRLLLAFMAFVMAVALFLSFSRGGIVACLLSTIFFLALSRRFRLLRGRKVLLNLGGAVILLTLALSYFDVSPLVRRFESIVTGETEKDIRSTIWDDTWRIYRDFPVLGTGLGSFERIYPHYKSFRWRMHFTHAENDYLQTAAEMGSWGIAGLAGVILSYFSIILSWRPPPRKPASPGGRRSRPPGWTLSGRGLVVGSSSGVLALLLQSVVNFNFSIPANALLLAVLAALALGQITQRQ